MFAALLGKDGSRAQHIKLPIKCCEHSPTGGAAEDVPVCLVLGTASVTAIQKKKKKKKKKKNTRVGYRHGGLVVKASAS